MTGPKPLGHWSSITAANIGHEYDMLKAGKRYSVIREFRDCDNDLHKMGETWYFLAYSFFPYDNGLQWFVTLDNLDEYSIPLYLAVDEFAHIAYNLPNYLKEI